MNGKYEANASLNDGLTELHDDFMEFNDYCSFLCDAVSCLFTDSIDGEPDNHTVMGLKRHCDDLKERAKELEGMVNHLYRQSRDSKHTATVKPIK